MSERILYSMFYDLLEQPHEAFKTEDGLAVVTPKAPAWLWLAQDQSDAKLFFESFLQRYKEPLVGLVAKEDIAMTCARLYMRHAGCSYTYNDLVAYYLPPDAGGNLEACGELRNFDVFAKPLISQWIQEFYEETLYTKPPEESENPGTDVDARLFILHDPEPVAMGMLASSKGKTCRLNLIYTPPEFRGKGYGKAMVSELVKIVRGNGQLPVLYTHEKNSNANNLYQSLGFLEAGRLVEVRFEVVE